MLLVDYNENKNFVEKFHQNLKTENLENGGTEWFFSLGVAVTNVFVFCKELKMSMKDFVSCLSKN